MRKGIMLLIAGMLLAGTPGIKAQQLKSDFKNINLEISRHWLGEVAESKDLPYPYVPAFKDHPTMFYWDSYFINKGLLVTGNLKLAKQNALNVLHVIDRYGYMGNAAMTSWGMNRSQPPYLSMMIRELYEVEKDPAFLKYAYPLLKREHHFWTDTSENAIENHRTSIPRLQRFYHHATDQELIDLYNEISGRLFLEKDLPDARKAEIGSAYAAEAETGMDFTPRFEGRCPDFVAVDLNCLLYTMEQNLAWMANLLKLQNEPDWIKLAARRKVLINKYCWDEQSGLYYDFNFVTGKRGKVAAVTTFQPLWTGIASAQQAKRVMQNIEKFETPYGLTTTEKGSGGDHYQWGSLSIWAPMQLLAAEGLRKYGFHKEARRVADAYMGLVAKNYEHPVSSKAVAPVNRSPGFTYEKYKADGTINDDEYRAGTMMGWTAAVFNYLYKLNY